MSEDRLSEHAMSAFHEGSIHSQTHVSMLEQNSVKATCHRAQAPCPLPPPPPPPPPPGTAVAADVSLVHWLIIPAACVPD